MATIPENMIDVTPGLLGYEVGIHLEPVDGSLNNDVQNAGSAYAGAVGAAIGSRFGRVGTAIGSFTGSFLGAFGTGYAINHPVDPRDALLNAYANQFCFPGDTSIDINGGIGKPISDLAGR